jgi:hypothetical protein
VSSSDERKHETLSAWAEVIKKLTEVENLLMCLKSMVLDVLRYTTSGKMEKFVLTFPVIHHFRSRICRITEIVLYTFLLRMTDTVTSQNIDLSSWVILYFLILNVRLGHVERGCTKLNGTFPRFNLLLIPSHRFNTAAELCWWQFLNCVSKNCLMIYSASCKLLQLLSPVWS